MATKIVLANYEEQKKVYGKFAEIDQSDFDSNSFADTEDFLSSADSKAKTDNRCIDVKFDS